MRDYETKISERMKTEKNLNIITEIDLREQKKNEKKINTQSVQLKQLANLSMQLVKISPDDNLFDFIAQKFKDILGDNAITMVIELNEINKTYCIKSIEGLGKKLDVICKTLGRNPLNHSSKVNIKCFKDYSQNKLTKVGDNLFRIAKDLITESEIKIINRLLNLKDIYLINFSNDKNLYATLTIATQEGFEALDTSLIESYASQISIALERWYTQKSLKESEEKYRMLFEENMAGVYESTINGKVINCNKAFIRMFGYTSKKELLNTPAVNFHQNSNKRENFIELIREKNELFNYESKSRKKDGSYIWALENVQLINNNIIQGTIIDITDIKKAEQSLIEAKEKAEEMNALKSSFLANIGHELRTPLIGIHGYSEILREEVKDNIHKEMASSIFECSQNLEETLNSILDLSKIEANKIDLNLVPTNISVLVGNIVNHFLAAAENKSLSLNIKIKEDNITAFVDINILKHILNNLINNALKFTNNGSIEVGINQVIVNDKKLSNIYVKDTGIGIHEKHLEHIFNEFRQVSQGNNRLYGGTGLGLTLVKKFVNLIDGTISVKSKLGEGSTFTIQLQTIEPRKMFVTEKKKQKLKK